MNPEQLVEEIMDVIDNRCSFTRAEMKERIEDLIGRFLDCKDASFDLEQHETQ